MLQEFNEDNYEEIWTIVVSTGGKYQLNKKQVEIVKNAMIKGSRIVVFDGFIISIPYVVELYREKRFMKKDRQLPEETREKEFKPVSPEKIEKLKKEIYSKLGK